MTVSAAQSDDAPRRWPASSSQRLLKRSQKGSDRPSAALRDSSKLPDGSAMTLRVAHACSGRSRTPTAGKS